MGSKTDFLIEEVLEKEWKLSRKFMREIIDETGLNIPINVLLASQNLQIKWFEYARSN